MRSAIVVIIVHRPSPSVSELASLKQCVNVLGNYPIALVCPEGLNVDAYKNVAPEIQVNFIDSKWLSSYAMFNRLKILPFIYEKFIQYEFILFYELDAWVFNDELEKWCSMDYDYIGAPWFENFYGASADARFLGVGNGGFSLRKTRSLLKALNSRGYIIDPVKLFKAFKSNINFNSAKWFLRNLTIHNNIHHTANDYAGNEDMFWGLIVAKKLKWFRTPTPQVAAQFAMEYNAPKLYAMNNETLPFGCHKWEMLYPDFWKQFVKI
jgi:hypothetical protein